MSIDYAQEQPQDQAPQGQIGGLPAQHPGQVALLHAQDVEDAEFLFPALHQEAVRIEQEDDREQRHHMAPYEHQLAEVTAAYHLFDPRILGQGFDDIVHGHSDDAGEHVGDVRPCVLFHVSCR